MKKNSILLSGLLCSFMSYAQVGINTTNPLGTFHIDGGKDNAATPTLAQQANDFIVTSTGATGIGAVNPDPSAKLQIEATNKGVLLPRIALTAPNDATTIPTPAKGLIVYNTIVNTTMNEGFYTNTGTPAAPNWVTYHQEDKTVYRFRELYDITATGPVNQTLLSANTMNDIDLGLTLTVTIPPFTQAKLVTTYSVPIGTVASSNNYSGYFGIRFLKNGAELPAGSRKTTAFTTENAVKMATVAANVGDTVTNNTSTPLTITYSLNGYIEATSVTGTQTIRFNMWNTTDPNFNWGRAYMSVQIFTRTTL